MKKVFVLMFLVVSTKRSILSEISSLFDPLALLSPVITLTKKFLQKLCQMKTECNDDLPQEEKNRKLFIDTYRYSNKLKSLAMC